MLSFRPACLHLLVSELQRVSQRPFTEEQFCDAMCGASEPSCSGSTSHLLSTMARAITALVRTRHEGNPVGSILPQIIACARHIANKVSASERQHVSHILYDFLSNRCDYSAIHLLLDQALDRATERGSDFWTSNITDFEHQIALAILEESNNNVEAELTAIKCKLGLS